MHGAQISYQEMPKERALGPHGVAALRTRFALRPQLHWAVKLQCPLCRIGGVAFVVPVPHLDEAPKEWFDLVANRQSAVNLKGPKQRK
eukprot:g28573.t1